MNCKNVVALKRQQKQNRLSRMNETGCNKIEYINLGVNYVCELGKGEKNLP